MEPADHLFRRESGRMVAALTRVFGLHNFALVEDVVQDAFVRALEVWKFQGMPENPSAWLLATARNRALDVLRREQTARRFAPELERELESEWTRTHAVDQQFEPGAIQDGLLRMMFSCCHPQLAPEAQVALVLHALCGFSVGEIAAAFLAGHAAIEKRIGRAKKVLAASSRLFDLESAELSRRLPAVQRALYLLFNEGYHGACEESAVRVELCREAMRLAEFLAGHPRTATPVTAALRAMMCLHAARLPARLDAAGDLRPLGEQDRSLWDRALIARGQELLNDSAVGTELSEYHVEAMIAAVHAEAARLEDTDWPTIIRLYDTLLALHSSPVIALGRALAIAEHEGPARGLAAILAIPARDRLSRYPFHAAALGELELRRGRRAEARAHFGEALALARNPAERRYLERRRDACSD